MCEFPTIETWPLILHYYSQQKEKPTIKKKQPKIQTKL